MAHTNVTYKKHIYNFTRRCNGSEKDQVPPEQSGLGRGELLGHRHKDSSRFKKTKSRQRWKWHKKKMRKNARYKRYMRKRAA